MPASRIGLAQALLALGDVTGAQHALAEPALIEDRWMRTHALDTLAMIRLVAGGLSPATRSALAEAEALAVTLGADPQMMAMIAIHTAVGEVASGNHDAAAQLLADTPTPADFDVLPMEAEFVRGAINLLRDNATGVRAAADRIAELVAANGHRMYLPAAARLREALYRPPPASTFPAMLWVHVAGRPGRLIGQKYVIDVDVSPASGIMVDNFQHSLFAT